MMFPETNSISIPGLTTYYHYLIGEEKSPTTITKYLRDLQKFLTYTAGRPHHQGTGYNLQGGTKNSNTPPPASTPCWPH